MPGSPDESRSDSTPAATSSGLTRRPGLVWLLALLIVPLVLTALLVTVKGDTLDAATADNGATESTPTPSPAPTPASSAATPAPAEATVAPFMVQRTDQALTVQAVVRDQPAKDLVVAEATALPGEGVEFVDKLSVDAASGLPNPSALAALLRALAGAEGQTSVRYDGATVTLSGHVGDQATKATAARAAAKAVPGAVISNQLQVPAAVKPPISEACQTFETRLAQLMSRNKLIFLSGTAIVNEASRPSVGRVAALLRSCATVQVEIAGHTDNLGDPDTSMPLSQRRADAIKAAMVRSGVPADRMISRGYGELQPIASNKTAAGRIANRRVEIRVP